MDSEVVDVAIIGGGPAGSTCASLLLKYKPSLRVVIVEREVFPRDHVGESQLPAIGKVLNEMGVWDKVERANFPVKIGATYRWDGRTTFGISSFYRTETSEARLAQGDTRVNGLKPRFK